MNIIKALALLSTLFTLAVPLAPAHAGRSCDAKPPTASAIERGLNLAEKTRVALDQSGAKVVVLARAGQDLSKYRIRYSHLGLAYKTADGRWLVLHKLNACGSDEASIYRQGLGEFFLDDLFRFEATWVTLKPDAQDALLKILLSDNKAVSLHEKRYNMLAYPWSTKYQQSNQWAIETLAMAIDPSIRTRRQAQAWLQLRRFEPSVITLDALTRLGGRMTSANIAFDDHPNEKRFADRIETVTVDSVMSWLVLSGIGLRQERLFL
ncbi:MAG: DUF2145 domain-containing protein [Betaproteobacteria bacterium]|nr:MAG: DUF2145 domain-containing protein [Betaproteobacteria bacterium]